MIILAFIIPDKGTEIESIKTNFKNGSYSGILTKAIQMDKALCKYVATFEIGKYPEIFVLQVRNNNAPANNSRRKNNTPAGGGTKRIKKRMSRKLKSKRNRRRRTRKY